MVGFQLPSPILAKAAVVMGPMEARFIFATVVRWAGVRSSQRLVAVLALVKVIQSSWPVSRAAVISSGIEPGFLV